jgi:MFS family permease
MKIDPFGACPIPARPAGPTVTGGMGPIFELWRREHGARPFFVALVQGALGVGGGYVAIMLVAYDRLGSAWAASLMLLPLLACALLMGLGSAIFRPAAFALIPTLVASERRVTATAAWTAVQDLGTVLGPAFGAGALLVGGAPALLALTAAGFFGSAIVLGRVRPVSAPVRDEDAGGSLMDGARAGLAFVRGDLIARVLITGTGGIVLASGMVNVAEVLLAKRDLHAGGTGFALLIGFFGIGMVAGSVLSAHSRELARLRLGYLAVLALMGAGMLGSALAPSTPYAAVSFLLTGIGSSASIVHHGALLQEVVPDGMLSRAHALNGTVEAWAFAAAALLGGALGATVGARGVFGCAGAGFLLVTAIAAAWLRPAPSRLVLPDPVPA